MPPLSTEAETPKKSWSARPELVESEVKRRRGPLVASPPTPAAHRAPGRVSARPPVAAPPPPAPAAPEPKGNVVQLNRPSTRKSQAAVERKPDEKPPKKTNFPRRRKPGLVKPA